MTAINEINREEKARIFTISDGKGDYQNPVFGEGKVNASVMFIGEAPGASEAAEGRPFVGKAGQQLDAMLALCGIGRKDLYVTNAVKFRPWKKSILAGGRESTRNRTPSRKEIEAASFALRREIELIRPNIIVTLGNSPLYAIKHICRYSGNETVGELHGTAIEMSCADFAFTLWPLYHPASGIYRRELVAVMENDLKKLADFAK